MKTYLSYNRNIKYICAVFDCPSNDRNTKDVSFFEFPKKENYPDLHKQWIILSKRSHPLDFKIHRMCSKHFKDNELTFTFDSRNCKISKLIDEATAKPSIFPGRESQAQTEALEIVASL